MFCCGIQFFLKRFTHASCDLCNIILSHNFRCNAIFYFYYDFRSWKKEVGVWNSTIQMIRVEPAYVSISGLELDATYCRNVPWDIWSGFGGPDSRRP